MSNNSSNSRTAEVGKRGSLGQHSINNVVSHFLSQEKQGILHFRFEESLLNTKIIIHPQGLTEITSGFLPSWSQMLVPEYISSTDFEDTLTKYFTIPSALKHLVDVGKLGLDVLQKRLQERLLLSMPALIRQPIGQYVFLQSQSQKSHKNIGISKSEWKTLMDDLPDLQFDPLQRFSIRPERLVEIERLNQQEQKVILSIASHLTLVEIIKRANISWSELSNMLVIFLDHQIIESDLAIDKQKDKPVYVSTSLDYRDSIQQDDYAHLAHSLLSGHRLEIGDKAPNFELPALGNKTVCLDSYLGKKVLLRFNRQAGCPICNPRNRDFIKLYPRLQDMNIDVISIFGSRAENLADGIGKQNPPFAVLADWQDEVYEWYGVGRSLWGLINPANFKHLDKIREGFRMETIGGGPDGEVTRMPAEFLIDEQGYIEQLHYHSFAMDFLPIETLVLDWLKLESESNDPD